MRKYLAIATLLIAACVTTVNVAHAQSALLDLPRDSQHAKVVQRVGITDIIINYHRPLVKGRKIWAAWFPTGRSGARARMRTPPSNSAIQST